MNRVVRSLVVMVLVVPLTAPSQSNSTVQRSIADQTPVSAKREVKAENGMVLIEGGDYIRGRTYDWPDTRYKWYPNPAKDDVPIGPVVISAFQIDETEVTNEQYADFVKATGRRPPFHWINGKVPDAAQKEPVANVSWADAVAFCTWKGKRLPTEAEWEKACRGGVDYERYPWGNQDPTNKLAHYGSTEVPAAVCSKPKNRFGLCDMAGNVWEWVHDWYSSTYYQDFAAPQDVDDPKGPKSGLYRVIRGGGWFANQDPRFMACSYRSWAPPEELSPTIGFRCAKNVQGAVKATSSPIE